MTWFAAGRSGEWKVERILAIAGKSLPQASRLRVMETERKPQDAAWALQGVVGPERYVRAHEKAALEAKQAPLGRSEATRAALIPIKKSEEWWNLPQDARRAIFEERSHHIRTGLESLPHVARRLYHCRDFNEPFDFLTWFEFAPEHEREFDDLVLRLRSTEEWRYVVREVDVRCTFDSK